jgi:N-acetylglutamate synthase-like GNAT family acetyltransferase
MSAGLLRVQQGDVFELRLFLAIADLTLSGLDDPRVHLWIQVDADGRVEASTGFELSGSHALIRSVAVAPSLRGKGLGSQLAAFALDRALEVGAERAWLFSRRSGPFWRKLGFEPANRDELVSALGSTHQVRAFAEPGQLGREIAWSKSLTAQEASSIAP